MILRYNQETVALRALILAPKGPNPVTHYPCTSNGKKSDETDVFAEIVGNKITRHRVLRYTGTIVSNQDGHVLFDDFRSIEPQATQTHSAHMIRDVRFKSGSRTPVESFEKGAETVVETKKGCHGKEKSKTSSSSDHSVRDNSSIDLVAPCSTLVSERLVHSFVCDVEVEDDIVCFGIV